MVKLFYIRSLGTKTFVFVLGNKICRKSAIGIDAEWQCQAKVGKRRATEFPHFCLALCLAR